ncbi:MAG: glycosyltransferase family 2 protein [Bacteroidales bacterium]|nr:glycosyltransferase family 2 protein [Bacteroidales bacterium]MDY6037019.1 glycosyltransferase family 2 protein [Paludibacteraceae bacterium]
MKTAVVILNYNGETLLRTLLPTVLAHSPQAEVIVADNASTDGSLPLLQQTFPQVRLIALSKNYGFAEGYNRALAQVDADYFVLLNSDVEVTAHWLEPLIDYMEHHADVAACQPKIMSYTDRTKFEYAGACGGYIDALGYPFCRGRIMATVETDDGQYDSVATLFWASGACLLVRADKFREVGGLDARFFAHMEEIDLCWRLQARGSRIVCIPQSTVYHIGAKTLAKEHPMKTYLNFRNNLLMIYKNMPTASKVLAARVVLDWVAAVHLLCQGKWQNFWAVLRAQKDFFVMRKHFSKDRQKNIQSTVNQNIGGVLHGSILWQYYVCRRTVARKLQGL